MDLLRFEPEDTPRLFQSVQFVDLVDTPVVSKRLYLGVVLGR